MGRTRNPRPRRRVTALGTPLALAGSLLLQPGAAAGQLPHAPPGPAVTSFPATAPVSEAEAVAWREDLAQLAHELVARHANAFHRLTREEFEAAVASLHARIPDLTRHGIIVEMMRLVASIGDGHTSVPVLFDPAAGFHALPLRFGLYAEGLHVEAADSLLESAVGARVTAVGGVPVDEALDRIAPLVSRDNDVWLSTMAPLLLARTEILHAAGLSMDPMAAELTLEREGRRRTLRVEALSEPVLLGHGGASFGSARAGWIDARDTSPEATPLWLRHPDRAYWREYLPEHRTLYVQFNRIVDAPHGPGVREFFEDAYSFVEENGVERLILDIRNNNGGEGFLNLPVVKGLVRLEEIDRPGGPFVIIGRQTFSAAQMLAHQLDRWTEAIFVGEPTGSSPRFYGDHSFFRLAHSGILVSAAPTWWQPGGPYDRRAYLPPRLAFEPRFEDYVANRDRALEAILAYDERRDLAADLLGLLSAGGTIAAESRVREWSADPINRYAPATAELNRIGYALLREGRLDDGLSIFRLNVHVHPEYANGWDSLGEALMMAGRREEALVAYRRAIELDPGVGRAAEVVKRSLDMER